MASYQWLNRATDQVETLQQVDRMICAHLNEPCSETSYHPLYMLAVEVGFAYLWKNSSTGKIPLDADLRCAFKAEAWDSGAVDQKTKDNLRWIFNTWEFWAWR